MSFCALDGKNIVVTGASSGFGRELCVVLSHLNATVCLVGRDEERLATTLGRMAAGRHLAVPFDLLDFSDYKRLFESCVGGVGKLSGLVHFAGVRRTLPLPALKPAALREQFAVNHFAFVELVRNFSKRRYCRDDGASIVAASSVMSFRGAPALSAYGSSKSAVDGAVRSLACELAPRRIRVNSVATGFIEAGMNLKVKATLSEEAVAAIVAGHPLGTGEPADVANMAAFLLSDEAKWITGVTIPVDGGFTIRS